MDAYLAIVSKRDHRSYADRPLLDEVVERILHAGRLAGSAQNRQPWRFLVLHDRSTVERAAQAVYEPTNLLGASLVIAVVVRGGGPSGFDGGRAVQNMMLAAWNDGVVSCPNGVSDAEVMAALLGVEADERPLILLSLGYPPNPRDPARRSAEEWIERANRRPLEDLVDRR